MRGVASLAVRWQAFFLLPRTVSRAPAARPPRGAPRAPRARARTGKRRRGLYRRALTLLVPASQHTPPTTVTHERMRGDMPDSQRVWSECVAHCAPLVEAGGDGIG